MQFTSEETHEILRRVAASDVPALAADVPMTLAELQRIGQELGLDPSEVARAAARYRSEDVEVIRTNLLDFEFVRTIPHPIDRLGWGFLVDAMRIATQAQGENRTEPDGALQWLTSTKYENVTLTLRNEQRSLSLKVTSKSKAQFGGMFGIVAGLLMLVFVFNAGRFDATVAALLILVLLGFATVTLTFLLALSKRSHQLSEALAEEFAGVISSSFSPEYRPLDS